MLGNTGGMVDEDAAGGHLRRLHAQSDSLGFALLLLLDLLVLTCSQSVSWCRGVEFVPSIAVDEITGLC